MGIWADEAPFKVKLQQNPTIWEVWDADKCFDSKKLVVGHQIHPYHNPPPHTLYAW